MFGLVCQGSLNASNNLFLMYLLTFVIQSSNIFPKNDHNFGLTQAKNLILQNSGFSVKCHSPILTNNSGPTQATEMPRIKKQFSKHQLSNKIEAIKFVS